MVNITTIGGGSGTYNLLKGIKNISNINISSIVNMSDDGGSTGRIRDEYGALPTGDLRRAITALSDDEKTYMLREILNHRFESGSLGGHNLGNLIMMALDDITQSTGKSIKFLEDLFDIKGRVYPVTFEKTRLVAKLDNEEYIIGETNIDIPKHDPNRLIKELYIIKEEYASVFDKINDEEGISNNIRESIYSKFFDDKPVENPGIGDVISSSDYIIFSPGDLYTSLLPNLLIGNVAEHIKESKAKKILFMNLFNKHGETTGFSLSDFINEFTKYLGDDIFDYIVMQDRDKVDLDPQTIKNYEDEGKTLINNDLNDERIIKSDFIKQEDFIRHDSKKIQDFMSSFIN